MASPAAAWLKWRANTVARGWNNVMDDGSLCKQMKWVLTQSVRDKPCHGHWFVDGDRAVVWTGTSTIATGYFVETPGGNTIKDMCWLWQDNSLNIYMVELDNVVCGFKLAIVWGMWIVELWIDLALSINGSTIQ